MSTTREKIYACTFTSRSRRVSGRVRAWDAGEALQLFRDELRETGVSARGVISVAGRAGLLEQKASYQPS